MLPLHQPSCPVRVLLVPEGYLEGWASDRDALVSCPIKGKRGEDDAGNETRTGGQAANILPAIGGAIAGLFTKKDEDGNIVTRNTIPVRFVPLVEGEKSAK